MMAKEYIERSTLDKWLHETMSVQTTVRGMAFVQMFWEKVRSVPAADVVEVVRCKDCKHSADATDGGNYLCNRKMLGLVRPNDFCSFGERRDNE